MLGQSAIEARNYFESLKNQKSGIVNGNQFASAHYIVDELGPVLCVPESEVAYHSGGASYKEEALQVGTPPWWYVIGIEMCFVREDGKPEDSTLGFTIELVRDICERHNLAPLHTIWRHYDMTGKICPQYYVKNEVDWTGLKQRIYESVIYSQEFSKRRSKCRPIRNFVRGLFGSR